MPPGRTKTGKTTMQDIANKLNVSKVSVSKALSGKSGVSEALRASITKAAHDMGYKQSGSNVSGRQYAFVIGKRFFLETDAFYSKIFYYFNKECQARGDNATLVIIGNSDEKSCILPAELLKNQYDGIAIVGQLSDTYLCSLNSLHYPMALIDFESWAVQCNMLLVDNFLWGYRATQYLIDHGHKKIGFVGSVGSTNSITDRYFGYRKALLLNELEFSEDRVLVNNDINSGLYFPDTALPSDMPSAFVCHCDRAAYFLINGLSARGILCPRDVSIISFDNTHLATMTQPALTCVNIDTKVYAQQAYNMLASLQNSDCNESKQFYIHASLIERDSVKKIDV